MKEVGTTKGIRLDENGHLQLVAALPAGYRDDSISRGFADGHLETPPLRRHLQLRRRHKRCQGRTRRPCWKSWSLIVSTVFALTVSTIERRAGSGPRRRLRPATGSDSEVVVRVGAQVKGQVTAGLRCQLTVKGIDPAVVQNHQLKLPEEQA